MEKKHILSDISQETLLSRNNSCEQSVNIRQGEKRIKTPTRMMQIKDVSYDEAIRVLADTADDEIFDNCGPEHATAVMANIFRTSNSSIKMYSGDLGGKVSKGVYLTELRSYLNRGGELSLILEKDPKKGAEFAFNIIEEFQKSNPEKVKIYYLKSDNHFANVGVHFTIGDNRMYRFETDVNNYSARCSFNDKAFAYRLSGLFDAMRDSIDVIIK